MRAGRASEEGRSLYCEKLPVCNALSFHNGRSKTGPRAPCSLLGRSCDRSQLWCCSPPTPPHWTVVPAEETTAEQPKNNNTPPTRISWIPLETESCCCQRKAWLRASSEPRMPASASDPLLHLIKRKAMSEHRPRAPCGFCLGHVIPL